MSWSSPPVASSRSRAGGKTKLLPNADREHRDAARVAFRVLVLLGEQANEPADLGAEERFLGRDELSAAEVAGKGTGRRLAKEVYCDRGADEQHAGDLEPMPEPPGKVHVGQHQGRDERTGEPDQADEDAEIRAPSRQQHGVQRAQGEQPVEREADDEHGDRGQAGGLGYGRHEARHPESDEAERDDADHQDALKDEQGTHGPRASGRGQSGEGEDERAHGQRGRPRQRDDAVHLDDEARARKAVHEQERGHDGERRADEHGARVAAAPAPVGQRDAGGGRDERREPDAPEVSRARELHLLRADEVDQSRRNDRRGTGRNEQRREAIPPHDTFIGSAYGILTRFSVGANARRGDFVCISTHTRGIRMRRLLLTAVAGLALAVTAPALALANNGGGNKGSDGSTTFGGATVERASRRWSRTPATPPPLTTSAV